MERDPGQVLQQQGDNRRNLSWGFPHSVRYHRPLHRWESTARGWRQDTRWMAMASPMVSMAPTSVTNTNAGRSAQKTGPKPRSKPGHPPSGSPTRWLFAASGLAVQSVNSKYGDRDPQI